MKKTDDFKQEIYFSPGDTILDPFCGSGTTLVQANELGINAIGIDVSEFNSFISNLKLSEVDLGKLCCEAVNIDNSITYANFSNIRNFDKALSNSLKSYNKEFFPSPDYSKAIKKNELDETVYASYHEIKFSEIFDSLIREYGIDNYIDYNSNTFLDRWYHKSIVQEMNIALDLINRVSNNDIQNVLKLILSRTMRSSRATTHANLNKFYRPTMSTYYCKKHRKICKPLFLCVIGGADILKIL